MVPGAGHMLHHFEQTLVLEAIRESHAALRATAGGPVQITQDAPCSA